MAARGMRADRKIWLELLFGLGLRRAMRVGLRRARFGRLVGFRGGGMTRRGAPLLLGNLGPGAFRFCAMHGRRRGHDRALERGGSVRRGAGRRRLPDRPWRLSGIGVDAGRQVSRGWTRRQHRTLPAWDGTEENPDRIETRRRLLRNEGARRRRRGEEKPAAAGSPAPSSSIAAATAAA